MLPKPDEVLARATRSDNVANATRALNAGAVASSSYASTNSYVPGTIYGPIARQNPVDRFDEHLPYVHNAALSGSIGVLSLLIHQAEVDADQRDRLGRTPLMVAAWSRTPRGPLPTTAVDRAVAFVADLSSRLEETFQDSVAYDNRDRVEALWEQATRQTSPSYRELLLATGEDPGPVDGPQRPSVREADPVVKSAVALQLLLDAGADPDARDPWGRTALAYAASAANLFAVRLLLDAGADPNTADSAGVTPLMVAADRAADPVSDALSAAVVRELLRGGADVRLRDRAGRTATPYVGDRLASRPTEKNNLPRSVTFAMLRAVERGGEAEAPKWDSVTGIEPVATLPPSRRADVGDPETRLGP